MRKLYLSGSFNQQDEIREIANALELGGYEITSSWLTEKPLKHDNEDAHLRWMRSLANEDVEDVRRADAIVVFIDVPSTTGGRHAELGLAQGLDLAGQHKDFYVVGKVLENVFQHRANIVHLPTIEAFMYEMLVEIDREDVLEAWTKGLLHAGPR